MTSQTLTHPPVAGAHLPATSVVGYGLGDFANNLAFSLSTTFLLYYYTDVSGLSAAAIGTMFLLFGAVPLLFLSFLTFHIPSGWADSSKLLYAYLTYAVLGLVYSLVNIPYGSLASAMTQSVHERAKLVAARTFGAAVGSIVLSFLIAPQISDLRARKATLSAADYRDQAQSVFTHTTLLFVLVGSIAYFLVFLFCREHVVRVQARVSIKDTFATLRYNKPLAYLCASSFFYLIGLFAVGGATAFYAQYVLGDIKYTTLLIVVNIGMSLLLTPFIPRIIDRFGKKNVYQWCGVLTVVGGVALFFTPDGFLWLALLFLAIKGLGGALINTVMFALEADTVEYGEWKSGQRSEGATYAIFSFTRKITQSLGGAIGAWALALGGYLSATKAVPNPVQPDSAILAIKATIGLVPAVAALIAMVVFARYPLNDVLFRRIRDEVEARKRGREHVVLPEGGLEG